jgi:hypothetical protein
MTLALILLASPLSAGDPRSSLLMVEGRVVSVIETPGEGGLAIVMVQLAPWSEDPRSWQLLLAPQSALADIGFAVEVGDQLKARVFPTAEGPAKVHKVLNLTRRNMVKMRTLSGIPLWDGSGAWQGGESRGLQEAEREDRAPRSDTGQ